MTQPTPTPPTYTAVVGNNADLIAHVAQLYFHQGDFIADVTYGKGVFWRKVDLSPYALWLSDKVTGERSSPNGWISSWDFTDLPYADAAFDVLVFDPPYSHNPGNMLVDANYQNSATTKAFYHRDIIDLYTRGMKEAYRCLKPNAYLLVKCKDEIESSVQRWSHIEIQANAIELGFTPLDLFIMVQPHPPPIQHPNQQHARKNHSYLWVFKKEGGPNGPKNSSL